MILVGTSFDGLRESLDVDGYWRKLSMYIRSAKDSTYKKHLYANVVV